MQMPQERRFSRRVRRSTRLPSEEDGTGLVTFKVPQPQATQASQRLHKSKTMGPVLGALRGIVASEHLNQSDSEQRDLVPASPESILAPQRQNVQRLTRRSGEHPLMVSPDHRVLSVDSRGHARLLKGPFSQRVRRLYGSYSAFETRHYSRPDELWVKALSPDFPHPLPDSPDKAFKSLEKKTIEAVGDFLQAHPWGELTGLISQDIWAGFTPLGKEFETVSERARHLTQERLAHVVGPDFGTKFETRAVLHKKGRDEAVVVAGDVDAGFQWEELADIRQEMRWLGEDRERYREAREKGRPFSPDGEMWSTPELGRLINFYENVFRDPAMYVPVERAKTLFHNMCMEFTRMLCQEFMQGLSPKRLVEFIQEEMDIDNPKSALHQTLNQGTRIDDFIRYLATINLTFQDIMKSVVMGSLIHRYNERQQTRLENERESLARAVAEGWPV